MVPAVINGSPYPPTDFTVPFGTAVTLTCDSSFKLEYNQEDVVILRCEKELPKCYSK